MYDANMHIRSSLLQRVWLEFFIELTLQRLNTKPSWIVSSSKDVVVCCFRFLLEGGNVSTESWKCITFFFPVPVCDRDGVQINICENST